MKRTDVIFASLALVLVIFLTRIASEQPWFTDAYYYFNAAERVVRGEGLTDPYLWTYVAAPDHLPAPSHLYWMPLPSLLAAGGMAVFNAPGSYAAAQVGFQLAYWGAALLTYWLGWQMGKTRRHAWAGGLLLIFSGFYARWWGTTDSFAPFALVGAGCLVALGFAAQGKRPLLMTAAAGALAALGHLCRADGPLLLIAGAMALLWPWGNVLSWRQRVMAVLLFFSAYGLVMLPWFARNLAAIGSPLPLGGAQSIWLTEYNDLFSYPAQHSAASFFAEGGINLLISTRLEALQWNLARFVAEQGMIVLTPFMLFGLWVRRHDPFVRAFGLYALGLHLTMTFIFPFPGYRGGLFHSAAALLPWWMALGLVGLDAAVDALAKRRRRWRPNTAKPFFTAALLLFAVVFSLLNVFGNRVPASVSPLYAALDTALPADARVMINDPAALYYFTGRGGAALPNNPPETLLEIADRYGMTYLLLDGREGTPLPLWSLFDTPPAFLTEVPADLSEGMKLYAFNGAAN